MDAIVQPTSETSESGKQQGCVCPCRRSSCFLDGKKREREASCNCSTMIIDVFPYNVSVLLSVSCSLSLLQPKASASPPPLYYCIPESPLPRLQRALLICYKHSTRVAIAVSLHLFPLMSSVLHLLLRALLPLLPAR